MTLKDKILDLLGEQYKPSDEPLIDELIYNFKMQKRAKDALEHEGLVINIAREGNDPYYQKNPMFSIYDTCMKNINTLYTKLNISPLDRRNWNLEEGGGDEFEKDFG